MRIRLPLLLLLPLILLAPLLAAPPASVRAADEKLIFAFYYPWDSPAANSSHTRYRPVQPYGASDMAAFRRQIAQASRARIDALIVSWTGSSLAQRLDIAQGEGAIRLSAYVETEQPGLRSQTGMVAGLGRLLAKDAQHPAFVRYRGKPVIFVWRPGELERAPGQSVTDAWRAVLDQADPGRAAIWSADGIDLSLLDAFDGLHQFGAALWTTDSTASNRAWRTRIDGYNRSHGTAKIWAPGAAPGHDNSRQAVPNPIVVDREGGAYYRRNFGGAIASDPDWICIVSWNEWGEATQIEPATEGGDLYLGITKEMVDRWKGPVPDRSPGRAFERAWARADSLVAGGAVQRGWLWGPAGFDDRREPYAETPGGQRVVRYYDKARMEITRPQGGPDASGYVTNGLLVREMIGGEIQEGDSAFRRHPRGPARVPAVGDATARGAITYADLAAVASWRGDNRAPDRTGQVLTDRLTPGRAPRPEANLANHGVTAGAYESALGHNIAAPFWESFSAVGPVLDPANGQVNDGAVVDWQADIGLPLMEPVWVQAIVDKQAKDVLLQCFERRCLTYTPDNAPEWRVEMGNVGRHYFDWRYGR